jgi:hypothetical protein
MAASNQDKFNYYVGSIFAILLDVFPRRTQLDFATLAGAESVQHFYDNGRASTLYMRNGIIEDLRDEIDFVYETINWLYETGYLIGTVGLGQFGRNAFVTLSPKALEILTTVPASVDFSKPAKSIGQELTDAVKSSAKKKVGELAGQALSYAIKLGVEAFNAAQKS